MSQPDPTEMRADGVPMLSERFSLADIDMEEVRAWCNIAKVRMVGPSGYRDYSERDLRPLTTETIIAAIKHVALDAKN